MKQFQSVWDNYVNSNVNNSACHLQINHNLKRVSSCCTDASSFKNQSINSTATVSFIVFFLHESQVSPWKTKSIYQNNYPHCCFFLVLNAIDEHYLNDFAKQLFQSSNYRHDNISFLMKITFNNDNHAIILDINSKTLAKGCLN